MRVEEGAGIGGSSFWRGEFCSTSVMEGAGIGGSSFWRGKFCSTSMIVSLFRKPIEND
jgi:hypothetical protein